MKRQYIKRKSSKRKRKKRTKRQILKEKLWELTKSAIRRRDDYICQHCGKPVQGRDAQTSHVISRTQSLRLFFDLVNLKLLCQSCHNWWHANPTLSGIWFDEKFPKRKEYLDEKIKEQIIPVKDYELQEWIKAYE